MTQVATATATFYVIAGTSDYYWRVLAPARAVGAKACLIPEEGGYYAITQPNDDSAFRWRFDEHADDDFIAYPDHEGPVAVWTRPDPARATHAKAMQRLGIRTLAETDDNYVGNPRLNVFMRTNGFDAKARLLHLKSCASMDGIVFSTVWLRDEYHRAIRKEFGRSAVPELFVCRNHVIQDDWPERVERGDGPLRVGWMGSPSHVWDVNLMWGAMMYARQAGCETWMVGYDPTKPDNPVTSEKAAFNVEQWRKVGHRHIGWQHLDGRQRLPLDIGLCPVLTNEFTLGKSDLKAVEYTIAGAAVVAWNNPIYNRDWVHGETALLVGSPQEMLDATGRLIRDTRLRETLVANAQQYVREERGLKQLRDEWGEALG